MTTNGNRQQNLALKMGGKLPMQGGEGRSTPGPMNFAGFTLTWFDCLMLAALIFGVVRGRKRGMSEELLDVLQWLAIIVLGGLLHGPLGRLLATSAGLGLRLSTVLSYIVIAGFIMLVFTNVKRAVGEKLVHSDAFGRFEYYLGMTAGAVRCFCVVLFWISILHAKQITAAERAATAKLQQDNFGSISFPTIGSLQYTVFHESPTGKFIARHLSDHLIAPMPDGGPRAVRDTPARRQQRDIDAVLK